MTMTKDDLYRGPLDIVEQEHITAIKQDMIALYASHINALDMRLTKTREDNCMTYRLITNPDDVVIKERCGLVHMVSDEEMYYSMVDIESYLLSHFSHSMFKQTLSGG